MPAPIHTLTISSSGWYEFNITSLFKNWLEYDLGEGGFTPNYGFALAASTTGVSSRHFCSANSANKLPSIVLEYTEDISIADGEYYIRSKYSDLYLDTEQNASANGNVIQYGFHGDNNQVWNVRRQDDGYYKLYSPWYDEPKCLNVESNPTQNGSNINVYDDVDRNSILFKIVSNNDGSYRIISKWSNNKKVLDVCGPSTAPTANIQIWEYVGVDQQKWIFEKKLPKFSTSTASSYSETITSMPVSNTYSNSVYAATNSYKSIDWESLSADEQEYQTNVYSAAIVSALAVREQYPLAADMLLHYLYNSGEAYVIPGNYIYGANEIHAQLLSLQNEIESSYISIYSPGISTTFGRRDLEDGNVGSDYTDWKLAVNRCELWAKGYISMSGTTDVLIKEIHVRDYYDWQSNYAGNMISLASSVLYQFHVYGLAKEYPVSGVYSTSEIIWGDFMLKKSKKTIIFLILIMLLIACVLYFALSQSANTSNSSSYEYISNIEEKTSLSEIPDDFEYKSSVEKLAIFYYSEGINDKEKFVNEILEVIVCKTDISGTIYDLSEEQIVTYEENLKKSYDNLQYMKESVESKNIKYSDFVEARNIRKYFSLLKNNHILMVFDYTKPISEGANFSNTNITKSSQKMLEEYNQLLNVKKEILHQELNKKYNFDSYIDVVLSDIFGEGYETKTYENWFQKIKE